jgi:hypothetical protein
LVGWLKVGGTANLQKPGHNREVRAKVGWLAVFCVFTPYTSLVDFMAKTANQPTSQPSGLDRLQRSGSEGWHSRQLSANLSAQQPAFVLKGQG